MTNLRLKGRTVKGERGATLFEMAIVITVLLVIIFGIVEFGRAIWLYHTVANAAREGTRYAMVRGAGNPGTGNPLGTATATDVETYVQNISGLGTAVTVTTTWTPDKQSGSVVQVTAQCNFQPVMPLLSFGPLTLTSTSRMVISF